VVIRTALLFPVIALAVAAAVVLAMAAALALALVRPESGAASAAFLRGVGWP
jgi:hypothetical protein